MKERIKKERLTAQIKKIRGLGAAVATAIIPFIKSLPGYFLALSPVSGNLNRVRELPSGRSPQMILREWEKGALLYLGAKNQLCACIAWGPGKATPRIQAHNRLILM